MFVIQFTGKMGSGKSFVANNLSSILNSQGIDNYRTSFTSEIKKVFHKYGVFKEFYVDKHCNEDIPLCWEDEQAKIFDLINQGKEEYKKGNLSGYKSKVREIYQFYGTEVVRNKEPDYWVKSTVNRIKLLPEGTVVILDDWRFPNEDLSSIFSSLKIKVEAPDDLRAKRLGYLPESNHKSESFVDKLKVDIVLENYGKNNLSNLLYNITKKILTNMGENKCL